LDKKDKRASPLVLITGKYQVSLLRPGKQGCRSPGARAQNPNPQTYTFMHKELHMCPPGFEPWWTS